MALGFPDDLFYRVFLDPKALISPNPYSTSTLFYNEVDLAEGLGETIVEWGKRPWWVRRAHLLKRVLSQEKEEYAIKMEKQKAELEKNKPQTVRADGRSHRLSDFKK